MFQRGAHKARFPVVMTGYARDQVDSVVGEHERRRSELWYQRSQMGTSLAEADGRVQALEARVSELEEWGAGGSPVGELADELLHKAKEIGLELESRVLSEAEAEREELKQKAEAAESARARTEEIVAKARRDREELGRWVEESHRQVAQFLEEGKVAAEEKARAVWEIAQDRLREPVFELAQIHEQQRAMVNEVAELQERIDTSWRRVISE